MSLAEDLAALGKKAGGDGRAILTINARFDATQFGVWVSFDRGRDGVYESRDSLEDVLRQAWRGVNEEHDGRELARCQRVIAEVRRAVGDAPVCSYA